ncbi:ATP-binding protein [Ferruginibacter sp.]|nr:sensor histidine kinase [Ferruginibacter sp.]
MAKKLGVLCVLQILFVAAFAQQGKEIDSIQKLIQSNIADSLKAKNLYKLGKLYADAQDSTNAVNSYFKGIRIAKENKLHQLVAYGNNEVGFLYELMNENILALGYYRHAINYSKQYGLLPELGKAYKNTAFAYGNIGNLATAVVYDDSTIAVYEKLGNLLEKANAINNQGLRYHYLNKNNQAIVNYQNALDIYDFLKEEKKKANTVLNIGQVHLQQINYNIALDFFNRAKAIAITTNNPQSQMLAENNIGVVYFDQKQYALAIPYFEKTQELAKANNNTNMYLQSCNNLGTCNESLGEFAKAEMYYKRAEAELLKGNQYESILVNYINQASLAGRQNKLNDCLAFCDKCFFYLNNYQGLDKYKHSVFETAAYANKLQGNYDKAFMLQDSQIIYKDATINEKTNAEILELQTKYETEKKELRISLLSKADSIKALRIDNQAIQINRQQLSLAAQQLTLSQASLQMVKDSLLLAENRLELIDKNYIIKDNEAKTLHQQQYIARLAQEKKIKDLELSKKNNMLIGVSVLVPLLILGGILFYKNKQQRLKSKLQAQLFEQQKMATINILAAEEKERKRIASDLHDGVGQLMTAAWLNIQAINTKAKNTDNETAELINKTMHLVDESCKEVRAVSHNMMPNALLKKGLVNAVREFLSQINTKATQINLQTDNLHKPLPNHIETVLYRIIQESVNNVIKHAAATRLDISINQDEEGIDVMIEDNGKGFNFNQATQKDGIGLQNIKSRIQYLNGTVEWNTAENKGTLVAIHIPETKA